jgi:hypothetical protein
VRLFSHKPENAWFPVFSSYIHGLFNNAVSSLVHTASKDTNFRYYPRIFLEELRKTTEDLSQGSRSPDLEANQSLPDYKSEAPPLGVHCLKMNKSALIKSYLPATLHTLLAESAISRRMLIRDADQLSPEFPIPWTPTSIRSVKEHSHLCLGKSSQT